ncbi:DUF6491 family protein [Thalassotalea profundi]|uniref:Lipoprotein n=1 Tax=Thalassotalea profundi TaxID=2036687 RepID=A0ABQ3IY42_9GAMM|nr:DUF6491 family protein [Thalassotalea profundi]GHE97100.1 hypothetical protein GCM10011501_28290 [Thalassotalea profundi]
MKYLITLITFLLVVSCSQKNQLTYEERDIEYKQYITHNNIADLKKVKNYQFAGWQFLSRKFIILSGRFKRKYLIESSSNCYNLEFAKSLIINRSSKGNLHARYDSLSTNEDPNLLCRIQTIYPLTVEQAKELANIGVPTNEDTTSLDS